MKAIYFLTLILFTSCSAKTKKSTVAIAQIITPYGEMRFSLSDKTPKHKQAFIELANAHYWDSLTFNRVIENFVIQGGCPDTPEGFTDEQYLLAPEFNDSLTHKYGALGIGRDENPEKNSAICQFYVVHNKKGLHRLDGNYMIIGEIIEGTSVLDSIGKVPTDSMDTPLKDIPLQVNILKIPSTELKNN